MARLMKEPFVHFLLLGLLIFAAYAWLNRGETSQDKIVIDQPKLDHLHELWRIQWRRDPSEAETRALLKRYLRQEVFYREAVRMGLDRNDEIVRRRMAQKMEAVADDLDTLMRSPGDAELRAFYEAHVDQFTQPSSYALEQVLFLSDESDREAAQAALLTRLRAGDEIPVERANKLGVANVWDLLTESELDNAFGKGFSAALASLPQGEWAGPVQSGFGWHLVKVVRQQPAKVAPFEAVRADVEREFTYQNQLESQEQLYQELAKRYTLEIQATGISSAIRAELGAR